MTNHELRSISITLSPAQVDQVVRAASQGRAPSVSPLVANLVARPLGATDGADAGAARPQPERRESSAGGYLPSQTDDPRLSRSLLRGLSILMCFPDDGSERGIVELAGDVGMSPSTAHRYATTLVELGLLERCPNSRKYRLPGT
jgi:IclR-like helix-turn-helix domain-containing protein